MLNLKPVAIAVVMLLLFSGFNCSKKPPDSQAEKGEDLKGKPGEVLAEKEIIKYFDLDSGEELTEAEAQSSIDDDLGPPPHHLKDRDFIKEVLDERGNIISISFYEFDSRKGITINESQCGVHEIRWEYDSDDRTISESYYDKEGEPDRFWGVAYGSTRWFAGDILRYEAGHGPTHRIEWTYYPNGRRKSITFYKPDGTIIEEHTF